MKLLVIFAKKYRFTDEKTGEVKSGLHVSYLDPEMREDTFQQKGDSMLKVPALETVFDKLTTIPAYYEIDFRQRPDSKGKPVLTMASAEFLEKVNYNEYLSAR
jgi:hypothetical protein